MVKVLFGVFLVVLNLFAVDIEQLKQEFYKDVVLQNINHTYLTKHDREEAILYHKKVTFLYKKSFDKMVKIIKNKIKTDHINHDEYFSFIDLKQQTFIVMLYLYDKNKIYHIGSDLISTGNMDMEQKVKYGEDHYFETPVGEYEIKKGWRSDGKFKDYNKTIQPYGSKGCFIYYVGKVVAKRYNTFDSNKTKILDKQKYKIYYDTLNFAIHSYNLNDKIYKRGFKSSHGCVRLSDYLNRFLDKHLVLHENFFRNGKWRLKLSAKPKNIINYNIKGKYLFILPQLD